MFSPEVRRRLSEIARGKTTSAAPVPAPVPEACEEYARDFVWRPTEERNELGAFCVSLFGMSELVSETAEIVNCVKVACEGTGLDPERLLFIDLETCGLAGVPVFLVGTMALSGDDFQVRQYFARDYSEEKSMLFDVREAIGRCAGLVSFNGRTFDVPFLRDRMTFHRLEFAAPEPHIDLLLRARKKWRKTLPNCRLQTLESMICRRHRVGDVPGSEIPALYHDFVRTGELGPLENVFKHNAMDLMTMAELLPEIGIRDVGVRD